MKMLNGNLLVKVQEDSEKRESGIIVLRDNKSYKKVEVIEPDADNEIAKGSIVYIPKNAGIEIDIEQEKYLIVNKREVILIL